MNLIKNTKTKFVGGFTWEEFEQILLPKLETCMPVALDRMEFHKNLISDIEYRFNFTVDSLEHFWNIYRESLGRKASDTRMHCAAAFAAQNPELVT